MKGRNPNQNSRKAGIRKDVYRVNAELAKGRKGKVKSRAVEIATHFMEEEIKTLQGLKEEGKPDFVLKKSWENVARVYKDICGRDLKISFEDLKKKSLI